MPQIETEEQLKDWLETQDWQVCTAIAARAALRSLPAIMGANNQNRESGPLKRLLLMALRATLTSAGAGTCPPADVKRMVSAANYSSRSANSARSAARSVADTTRYPAEDSAAKSAVHAAWSAADSSTFPAAETTGDTAFVAALFATKSSALSSARSSAFSAAFRDGNSGKGTANPQARAEQMFRHTLWHDGPGIAAFQDMWQAFQTAFAANGPWSFWCEWYRGMLAGQPLDWELQRRVALIADAIWEQGPEAVTKEIERIKAEFEAQRPQEPRFPAYEPNDLRPLIQNRIIATASLQGLAVQISDAIGQYHSDTGVNALPEALSPLEDMPALMNAVADRLGGIQQPDDVSSETEQALREEIGRLNAKVAELESKLSALNAEIESLSRSEKGKVFSLIRNTALLGGLVSGLWAMSGDELGARARYENIIAYTNDIRALLMREGLPQTQVETSLRPRMRPDKST
ncbi:hypothetical protein [Phycobacter sp. K97]|uniref:hypothetical protein n=1 Tax=Phycobacter sedimenti TaxID=3133977 RepID=UPI00311DA55C